MKKSFKIMSLAVMATLVLAGCNEPAKTTGGDDGDKISLTLSTGKTALSIGEETTLTVKASANVENALTVNIAVEGNAVSSPASLVIEKGKNEVTGTIKGIASGSSKITITAQDVEYGVQYVDVTVSDSDDDTPPAPDGMEIGNLYATGTVSPSSPFFNLVCESDSKGKVYPGSLYYHEFDWLGGTSTGIYKTSIDTYGGAMVGKMVDGEGFFTTYDQGTVIDNSMPWLEYAARGYGRFPIIVKENDATNSIPDGTHYIVLSLPVDGDPNNYGWENAVNMPCWLKIQVDGMKVTVLEGAMRIDGDGDFKVGMK